MAKAFFNTLVKNKEIADSAGIRPATQINPVVIQVMQEAGIDIGREIPKSLTIELFEKFDRMITMGCGVEDSCPAAFLPTEDWGLDDPADKPIEEVRRIRDEIKTRVEKLVAEL
jgi:arsenate reductase